MALSIAYITCRRDPHIRWFIDSLRRQTVQMCKDIRIIVVDFFADMGRIEEKLLLSDLGTNWVWTAPKPCVWQGPHRLTKQDWFAASNARNTALCLAPDGWLVYVDDISVLMPGWLNAVQEAIAGNYIALGAYKKVRDLRVEKGEVISFFEHPAGVDSRWNFGKDNEAVPATGGMMFGCSVAMPVEALLTINGWPEDLCDGCGSEDYCCGLALQNNGYQFKYDRRMLTLESEELHHVEPAFRREDYGVSPNDKSHGILNIAMSSKNFPNSFGEGGIRALRERVLKGEPFPVPGVPDREWYTKKLLSEL